MKNINLTVMRHRRSNILAREKKSVRDSIYNSLVNTDRIQPIGIGIEQLSGDDTGVFFIQWDTAMNELV